MNNRSQTWHYGLVARYWAEHNTDGPEIAYFQKQIELHGQPAHDAGCGTGRLLIPFLRAGMDVDGSDVSADMLALCRDGAERENLKPRLYQQPLHELDLPRTYQSIVVCGVFGVGVSRQQDFIALQRLYQHLKPGGVLLLDNHLPYKSKAVTLWQKNQLPEPWPDSIGKTPPKDGSGYELHGRVVEFNPLEQRIVRQLRVLLWRNGKIIAEEEYTLATNEYFCNELRMMLEQVGFKIEAIQGNHTEAEATSEHDVIVFIARKS